MDILLKVLPIAIPVILVILIFLMGYVKAPPDVAYIISGLRKHPKVLIGKAGIKIPFLERVDKLIVRQISIDIKSEGYIPTQDFIGVDVDAVAKVRVMTDPEGHPVGHEELPEYDGGRLQPGYRGFLAGQHA